VLLRLMPTEHIVALLIQERDKLNRAIDALRGSAKRRGRPPKNAALSVSTPSPAAAILAPARKKKKRIFTAAQRKGQAARMKRYLGRKEEGYVTRQHVKIWRFKKESASCSHS
jgi:hypothetical protein